MSNNTCRSHYKPSKKWRKNISKHQNNETELVSTPIALVFQQTIEHPDLLQTANSPAQEEVKTTDPNKFDLNCDFAQTLLHDYRMLRHLFKNIVANEQKKVQDNERELDELKKYYINLKMEEAKMKRKRWCSRCEMEATYLSTHLPFFFCTAECEQLELRSYQEASEGGSDQEE